MDDEEFFPNGQLRLKEKATYEDAQKRNQRIILSETFSPKGKSTGKVVNGAGETRLFDAKPDSPLKRHRALREVYKNGIEANNEEADAAPWPSHCNSL